MSDHRSFLKEVMFLDNFTCVYCGKHTPDLTIDHYIPQDLGGPDVIQNLVAACQSCNSSKNNKAPYEWGRLPQYGRFSKFREQVIATAKVELNQYVSQQVQAKLEANREKAWFDHFANPAYRKFDLAMVLAFLTLLYITILGVATEHATAGVFSSVAGVGVIILFIARTVAITELNKK